MRRNTSSLIKYAKHDVWPFLCPLLLSFCAILLMAVSAHADTYYVAKNGNDNINPGTEAQPWQTIRHAADRVSAGDTVYVKAGRYNERITIAKSGNATDGFITLRNYPGDKPIMDGIGLGGGYMIYGAGISYIKIQGFHITNYIGAGINFWGGGRDFSHIEIRDNEISNQSYVAPPSHPIAVSPMTWPGPVFHSVTDVIVDGNYIHDVDTGLPTAYNETLTLAWNISRFQITNNIIDNSPYIGIDLIGKDSWGAAPAGHPHQGIISGNTISNVGFDAPYGGNGIYIDGARNVIIENNKVYQITGTGIVPGSEGGALTTKYLLIRNNEVWNNNGRGINIGTSGPNWVEDLRVVHNTVYAGQGTFYSLGTYGGTGTHSISKNNILQNSASGYHMIQGHGRVVSPTLDCNCWWPASGKPWQYGTGHYTTFSAYQSGSGQDTNGFAANPLFTDASQRDFSLQEDSPCIDTGGPLTTTKGAGSGKAVTVNDAAYFSDGYGVTTGDSIIIGSNAAVTITDIDYATKVITIDEAISWNSGDAVNYQYNVVFA